MDTVKNSEAVFKFLIMKVNRYFIFGGKNGVSVSVLYVLENSSSSKNVYGRLLAKIMLIKTFSKSCVKSELE